jgi:hypothetical protein
MQLELNHLSRLDIHPIIHIFLVYLKIENELLGKIYNSNSGLLQ